MDKLLRLLLEHPLVAVFLVTWILGGVVNSVRRAGRGAGPRPRPQGRPGPPPLSPDPVSAPAAPPRRTPDEVAAEMRRLLGLDTVEVVPEQPVVRPVHREAVPVEAPPEPIRVATRDRHLDVHVASHVGEQMQRRKDPHSGLVGAQRIGGLGGRAAVTTQARGPAGRLVDLGDLKRAVLAAEILGPPLALRGERLERH